MDHALTAGIGDLSLRELAAAIGTSHRMLIYHFGSREGLLVAVTRAVEETQRAALASAADTPEDAWALWQRLSHPTMWPQERLFFELYSYALLGRPGTEALLDGIVESWVVPIADAYVRAGVDEATARAEARLGVAVVRGLLLDLLATGDRNGVDDAYRRFLDHSAHVVARAERSGAAAEGQSQIPAGR
jgi:AcrR family transcriptional regulator